MKFMIKKSLPVFRTLGSQLTDTNTKKLILKSDPQKIFRMNYKEKT